MIQIKVWNLFSGHIPAMKSLVSRADSPILWICWAKIVLFLATLLLSAGCGERKVDPAENLSHYQVKGVVRGLPPGHRAIEIEHEDIPGFMPSMTMPFEVRETKEVTNLQIGDAVSFQLNVTRRDSWIDQVRKIGLSELHLPAPATTPVQVSESAPRMREGDLIPEFQLVNQDGRTLTRETFRGEPFVLTFVFTRCAIPNFCPLMSRHFAALQEGIKTGPDALKQTRLLSISFDPFDTPQVLKSYAENEKADPAIWNFATGQKSEIEKLTHAFSVFVQPEGGTISHGLATALIDGHGKILKIWRGNGWNPSEILRELAAGRK